MICLQNGVRRFFNLTKYNLLIKIFFLFLLASLLILALMLIIWLTGNEELEEYCFIAAVYEHSRYGDNETELQLTDPFRISNTNLKQYSKVAKIAAQHRVQILVFPESGLFNCKNRKTVQPFLQHIPSATQKVNLCNKFKNNPQVDSKLYIVVFLSCLAREHSLYIDVTLGEIEECNSSLDINCPSDNSYKYNTQIVFDADGQLVAKYRKHRLFFENEYDPAKVVEIVSFHTTFGTFGLVTCFDALFEQPLKNLTKHHQIDTLIFSSWWFDELPFLTAPQFQLSLALTQKVNVLASNINILERSSVGSGIYTPNGIASYSHDIKQGGSKLIISKIAKSSKDSFRTCSGLNKIIPIGDKFKANYQVWKLNFSDFQSVKLTKGSDHLKVWSGSVCCELDYTLADQYLKEEYFLISFKRQRSLVNISEESCGFIAYDLKRNDYNIQASNIFESIKLTGNFTTVNIFPSVLTNQMRLLATSNWNITYLSNTSQSIQIVRHSEPITSIALYARSFDHDDYHLS